MENCRVKTKECQPTLGSYATHLVWLGASPLKPQPYGLSTRWTFWTFTSPASRRLAKESSGVFGSSFGVFR